MSLNAKTDFGANNLSGDGVTDDTTKLQAILDTMGTGGANAGKQLLIPAGVYKLTGQVNFTRAGGYNIVGEGPLSTVLTYFGALNSSSAAMLSVAISCTGIYMSGVGLTCNTPGGQLYGLLSTGSGTIADVRLTAVNVSYFAGCGFRLAQPIDRLIMDGCEFSFNALAAYGQSPTLSDLAGACTNSTFKNCYFHDSGQLSTLNHSMYLNGGCKNVLITSCTFRNTGYEAIAFGTSSELISTNYGLTVSNNQFVDCVGAAVSFSDSTGVSIVGNTISGKSAGAAITCGPDVWGWNISNNSLVFSGNLSQANNPGLTTLVACNYNSSGGVISNNTASFNQGYVCPGFGIKIQGGSDIDIFQNTFVNYEVAIAVTAANGAPYSVARINIRNNNLILSDGYLDNVGGRAFFNSPSAWIGVVVNGNSRDVYMQDNHIRNYPYGVGITNQVSLSAAPAFTTANIGVTRNRFYNVNTGLWFMPTASPVNVAFDNNFGGSILKDAAGSFRNLRQINNAQDGSFWATPGLAGTQTII